MTDHVTATVTVVGMRFVGIQPDQVAACARLVLVPEPTNKYDANAIMVFAPDGRTHLGHLSRENCEPVKKAFAAAGIPLPATVDVRDAFACPGSVQVVFDVDAIQPTPGPSTAR